MEIGSAGALASARTLNLWQAVRAGRQAAGTETPDALAGLPAVTARAAPSSNMLATNFVQSDYKRSTYLSATLNSFQTKKNVTNRMESLLGAMVAQYKLVADEVGSKYLAASLMQRRVERGVAQIVRQEVADGAEQTFEDLKDNIEDQAAAPGTKAGTEQAAAEAAAEAAAAAAAAAAQATTEAPDATGEGTASAAAAAAAKAFAAAANALVEAPAQPVLDVAV